MERHPSGHTSCHTSGHTSSVANPMGSRVAQKPRERDSRHVIVDGAGGHDSSDSLAKKKIRPWPDFLKKPPVGAGGLRAGFAGHFGAFGCFADDIPAFNGPGHNLLVENRVSKIGFEIFKPL